MPMDIRKMICKSLAVSCWLLLAAVVARPSPVEKPAQKPAKTVYDYSLVGFDSKELSLSTFKGKVLLIVNLASQSIFHDQIALLDELQKTYKDKGLVVIGVPSNDFGAQEPGTDADIQKMYTGDMHLSFPVFARRSVRGKDQAALYSFLTGDKKGSTGGDVHWSYTKFLVDRTGKVVARFEPHVAPNSPELQVTLEDVLAGTFKPPAPKDDSDDKKKDASERSEDEAR
jgi:glutathione peroxidase